MAGPLETASCISYENYKTDLREKYVRSGLYSADPL